ncbi:MAG: WecB/TagA/CpsF family glycosyltransferase [Actinomycetota bacterium]|nr:WecB/TagA/CpsF family glycosyltransferase [Actinomycetota bacterium]
MNEASARFAKCLAHDWSSGRVTVGTWINHHGALQHLAAGTRTLGQVDYVGVDGLLLMRLLGRGSHERTSADLVLPVLLPQLVGARIALVGSDRPSLDRAASVVADDLLAPGATIVDVRDGYAELPDASGLSAWVQAHRPDVVVVGLGTVLQEQWALDVAAAMPSGLVLTCGGFFDQVQQAPYYPWWAYDLRLNWAVRFAREPRRLWRRYSLEAAQAINARQRFRTDIGCLPGYLAYRAAVAGRPVLRVAPHNGTKRRRWESRTMVGSYPKGAPEPWPESRAPQWERSR